MLPIFTSEPAAKAGEQVIHFRRKKVAEAESYRAVCVPSYKLPSASYQETVKEQDTGEETLQVSDAEEVFAVAIAEAFLAAASSILRKFCDEKGKDAKEISADLFSFSAVIAEMQVQQTSQRLNAETIAAWYDSSETKAEAMTRYGEDEKGKRKQGALREKYLSLASNNPAIPMDLAVKMLAYISTKDAEYATCKAVCKRLERLTKVTVDSDEL